MRKGGRGKRVRMGATELSIEENVLNNVVPTRTLAQYSTQELIRLQKEMCIFQKYSRLLRIK